MLSIFISIIVPVCNKEKTVEYAILSVISQSYRNYELIIVDDGSTDSSQNVIRKLIEGINYIRLVSQINMGVSVARNRGAKEAQYEYLAFLDADDLWHPDYLKNMAMALTVHPESKWVAANYERFVGSTPALICENMTLSLSDFKYVNYFEESCLINGKQSIVSSDSFVVIKDFFFLCGGYPDGIQASEDYDLYFRMARFADPLWTEKILAFYREDAENQLSKKTISLKLPPYLSAYFFYCPIKHKWLKELRLRTLYNLINKAVKNGTIESGFFYRKAFLSSLIKLVDSSGFFYFKPFIFHVFLSALYLFSPKLALAFLERGK